MAWALTGCGDVTKLGASDVEAQKESGGTSATLSTLGGGGGSGNGAGAFTNTGGAASGLAASGGAVSGGAVSGGAASGVAVTGGAASGGAASGALSAVTGGSAGTQADMSKATGGSASAPATGNPPRGFVVHEWGTNTVVSGSDGVLQLGLHHEEEDLPPFVYNRLETAVARPNPDPVNGNVHVKMETPVLYFYSDKALTVHASVRFPSGVFTQWYPGVASFRPPIVWETYGLQNGSPADARDPAVDRTMKLTTAHGVDVYRQNGLLDWGAFEVLAPGVEPETLQPAPLESYTWSYARNVQANAVRFPDKQSERFLFYRGLSNLSLPGRVLAHGGGRITLANSGDTKFGAAFLIDVRGGRAAFVAYPEGVPALGSSALQAPQTSAYLPFEAFESDLSEAVMQALVAEGLYADEARAMVDTWRRQWFGTPGLRVLYLAPQSWTESVIPLTLDPVPSSLLRVMMVRVEVLTPELEAEDVAALSGMASDPGAAQAYFGAMGRFAEPRLRRALALMPSSAGEAYLEQVTTEVSRVGSL